MKTGSTFAPKAVRLDEAWFVADIDIRSTREQQEFICPVEDCGNVLEPGMVAVLAYKPKLGMFMACDEHDLG